MGKGQRVVLLALVTAYLATLLLTGRTHLRLSAATPSSLRQEPAKLQCAVVCSGSCGAVPSPCRRSSCSRNPMQPACGHCFGAANCGKCYTCALAALRRLLPLLGKRKALQARLAAAVVRGEGGTLLFEALQHAPTAEFSSGGMSSRTGGTASGGAAQRLTWALPKLLERGGELSSCIAAPRTLCAGLRRRDMLLVDTQDDATPPPPPWAVVLTRKASISAMRRAIHATEAMPWVNYCHRLAECSASIGTDLVLPAGTQPEWSLWPMFCMGEVNEGAVAAAGLGELIAEAQRLVPGLLNMAFSRSAARSHITPHCDGTDGLFIHRFQLAVIVPEPAAHFRICGDQVYTYKVGELYAFNQSLPHEVLNLAPQPRVMLLFDVLRPELLMEVRLSLCVTFSQCPCTSLIPSALCFCTRAPNPACCHPKGAEKRRAGAVKELLSGGRGELKRGIRSANKAYRQRQGM